MKVFEYLVFKTEEKDKDGKVTDPAVIIIGPEAIVAKDEHQARMIAARAIPEDQMEALDRLVIVCRPF